MPDHDRRRANVPEAVLDRASAAALELLAERHRSEYLVLLEAELAKAAPIRSVA